MVRRICTLVALVATAAVLSQEQVDVSVSRQTGQPASVTGLASRAAGPSGSTAGAGDPDQAPVLLIGNATTPPPVVPEGPYLYRGPGEELLVKVESAAFCSGVAVAGRTHLVLVAAHCVLNPDGSLTDSATVTYQGRKYRAKHIRVDARYAGGRAPGADAAVLTLEKAIPSPGVHLDGELDGLLLTLGWQRLDEHGALLRDPHYRTDQVDGYLVGDIIRVPTAAAACVSDAADAQLEDGWFIIRCGMIPGASGGPTVTVGSDGYHLVGLTSIYISRAGSRTPYANGVTGVEAFEAVLGRKVATSVFGDDAHTRAAPLQH